VNAVFPHLPSAFYTSSDVLIRVRKAAYARQVSPDAVLAVILCRVAASLPPGIVLSNGGTLDFVAALVGSPGTGKSKAMKAATDLLPDVGTTYDGVPIGSGEGIATAYVGKVDDTGTNPLRNSSALFYVDEGEQLLKVGRRDGSTTFATIRSCWSGQAFGSLNASTDRRRVVKAGTYRFALAVGFQPTFAAELLTGQDAGDPQRYLFAGVTNPDIPSVPPPFPDPLRLPLTALPLSEVVDVDADIAAGIARRRAEVATGRTVLDALDTHRDYLTLKVAALLSFLDGEGGDVTPQSWNLANEVVENGRNVRTHLISLTQSADNDRFLQGVERKLQEESMREERRDSRMRLSAAGSMIRRTKRNGRPVTKSILMTAVSGKHRNVLDIDDVIDFACEVGTEDGRLKREGDYFAFVPAD